MRFYSKQPKYRIVLRRALAGNPSQGIPPVPSVSIDFNYGIADVEDAAVVEMATKNRSYGVEYFGEDSPLALEARARAIRTSEPVHQTYNASQAPELGKEEVSEMINERLDSRFKEFSQTNDKKLNDLTETILSAIKGSKKPKEEDPKVEPIVETGGEAEVVKTKGHKAA